MIDPLDNATQALPGVEPRWVMLLKGAIAAHQGRGGVSKAAAAMGVSRVYVARVLMTGENRIKVPSQIFIKRVMAAFGDGRLDCPHLARDLALGECTAFASRQWKVIHGSGPEKVLHWRACQRCPQNPVNPVKAKP